eukprot:Skav231956  [mRNA]  locus=scaffold2806:24655:38290:- [translate_table: standard]
MSATGYTYCQKRHETFSGHAPNVQILENCMRKQQQLEHLLMVKPQHLFEHGGSLQRPQDFFKAAFQAGFRILVGSFRENQLARDLSSFELMTRQSRKDPNYVIDPDGVPKVKLRYPGIVESYEELRANYSRGLEAAYELGFTIVPLSFEDLITDTCDCVARTIKAVKLFDDLQNFTKCKAVATHISPAHTNQTLDSATNAEVASIVRSELMGTPYEWMLDLDAMDWPPRVQPRSPVKAPHQRRAGNRNEAAQDYHNYGRRQGQARGYDNFHRRPERRTNWQKGSDALQHYHEQGQQAFDAALHMGHYIRGNAAPAAPPAPQDCCQVTSKRKLEHQQWNGYAMGVFGGCVVVLRLWCLVFRAPGDGKRQCQEVPPPPRSPVEQMAPVRMQPWAYDGYMPMQAPQDAYMWTWPVQPVQYQEWVWQMPSPAPEPPVEAFVAAGHIVPELQGLTREQVAAVLKEAAQGLRYED